MVVMDVIGSPPLAKQIFSPTSEGFLSSSCHTFVRGATAWSCSRLATKRKSKQVEFVYSNIATGRKSLSTQKAWLNGSNRTLNVNFLHSAAVGWSLHGISWFRLRIRASDNEGKDNCGSSVTNTSRNSFPPVTEELLQDLVKDAVADSNHEEEITSSNVGRADFGIGLEEGYVGLFIRMLGLDKSAEEREEAVRALWRHSGAGKQHVDEIVRYSGCLTLVITLIASKRPATSEAAAGLLRNISAIESYRSMVAEAGAIEEIVGLLSRGTASPEVIEQAACVLWNLSAEESYRQKLSSHEFLLVLLKMLDSSKQVQKEAAAGILANLASSNNIHSMLMDAGAIPKLAQLLKDDANVSKTARQEARNALLLLVKNEDTKLAVLEEGLVPVPLIGASAFRSLKPHIQQAPSLPEPVKLEQPPPCMDSTFGAGELLLGLRYGKDFPNLDDSTKLVVEGRVRQQFLARIGIIETDHGGKGDNRLSPDDKTTLMPWWDGIPRLILILGLEDAEYARRAAESIAEIAFSEENRQAVAKAGGVPHLVRLLGCGDEGATEAVSSAIEKLAYSHKVRKSIDAHGAVPALVAILKVRDCPETVKGKVVAALFRLSQTGDEIKAMIQAGAVPGLLEMTRSQNVPSETKAEAEEILEEISNLNAEPRDKIVMSDGITPLIELVSTGSSSLKEKAASVLENLATNEAHALQIVRSGLDQALKKVFEFDMEEEAGGEEIIGAERLDAWLAVSASARLLEKLLRFSGATELLDIPYLINVLKRILRAETPLHVKDWVSACLLRLSRNAAAASVVQVPLDLDVTVHDVIPRLVEEIGVISAEVQERAVLQLRDLVREGVQDFTAAIANSGGIFPLVQLLAEGTPAARAAAVPVLYSLSMNDENHPAIVAAGAVPLLERIVRAEANEWKLALYLLRVLPT